ncbi:alpha-amylase family glycosyl hydrolase [Spirochaetota bacterium]
MNRLQNGYFEMRISRLARERYSLDDSNFAISGDVIFASFSAAREMTSAIEQRTGPSGFHPKASEVFAMALLHEVYHRLCAIYRETKNPEAFTAALKEAQLQNAQGLEESLLAFTELFPPQSVYKGNLKPEEWLEKIIGPRAEESLEELLLLRISLENPALGQYNFLFDPLKLRQKAPVDELLDIVEKLFKSMPLLDGEDSFLDALRAPARLFPHSIEAQLDYVARRWGNMLGDRIKNLLLGAKAMLLEEHRPSFPPGPGPVKAVSYAGLDSDYEGFSSDKDWMPKVVMIAKSTLVWLDQLSKKYQRHIHTLDAIPDEELELLAGRGFNGLWLIGIWERSDASRRIKELCGNPEAAASAYSLYDYEIAWELGGWPALEKLRARAWAKGIRLAADMVPNHTGIDSAWVRERPELFISRGSPPFPAYSYNGENLSADGRYGLWIEDHYYDRRDAAVTFKRVDFLSGDVRYIYHGNDGTSMPWNDTAQIDFLKKEAREAVKERILHVAKNFPIIRFDAAMVLAKRSFRRLWYPEPGAGDAIASRFESALGVQEFNTAFPNEFWREVVDLCAQEAPDTLLLAEAFWMMEGYFVRTLGMHRVYNSAFMNMLKMKNNAEYRAVIKNTIEFDKDILKRFVNFMNNPDEDTAIAQFGNGDHYFGVCSLMATMPGLPMFGHGQFEGYTEKYGMEYRKAYVDESPDQGLVDRHYREIVPLLKRRRLFSGVEDFLFYDFTKNDGHVDENVFAYSNGHGKEKVLVLFNNSWERSWGRIKQSCIYMDKREDGNLPGVTKSLAEGLGLNPGTRSYVVLTEERSGLSFLRDSRELAANGLSAALDGFQCQVFSGIYQLKDDEEGSYSRLCQRLAGRGVPDMNAALEDLIHEALYAEWRELFSAEFFRLAIEPSIAADSASGKAKTLTEDASGYAKASLFKLPEKQLEKQLAKLIDCLFKKAAARSLPNAARDCAALLRRSLKALKLFRDVGEPEYSQEAMAGYAAIIALLPLAFVGPSSLPQFGEAAMLAENLGLRRKLAEAMAEAGMSMESARMSAAFALVFYSRLDRKTVISGAAALREEILSDTALSELLGTNYWQGSQWINAERASLFFTMEAMTQTGIKGADTRQARSSSQGLLNLLRSAGWKLDAMQTDQQADMEKTKDIQQ